MSRSDWGKLAALGGLAAIALATIAFSYAESKCEARRDRYVQDAQQTGTNGSREQSQFTHERPLLPCLVEEYAAAPEAGDPSEKEQRDLIAQESMALWAFWMLFAVTLQTAVAVWGIIYIRRTLEHSREVGQLQLRPWLIFETPSLTRLEIWDMPGERFVLHSSGRIKIRNVGATPAFDVQFHLLPVLTDDPTRQSETFAIMRETLGRGGISKAIPPQGESEMPFSRGVDVEPPEPGVVGGIFLSILVMVLYRFHGEKEWRETSREFSILTGAEGNDTDCALDFHELRKRELPGDDIRIRAWIGATMT